MLVPQVMVLSSSIANRAVFANARARIFSGKYRDEPGSSFAAPQASA